MNLMNSCLKLLLTSKIFSEGFNSALYKRAIPGLRTQGREQLHSRLVKERHFNIWSFNYRQKYYSGKLNESQNVDTLVLQISTEQL